MWIRSQDKEFLASVDNGFIYINSNRILLNKLESDDNCAGINLGQYSSKEKMLKVLDMIQNHLTTSFKGIFQQHEDECYSFNKDVFQMPQDDEV